MILRRMSAVLTLSLLAVFAPARAGEPGARTSSQQFAALKQLAGDWVEIGKDGRPTEKVISSMRVTAGGTAVQETLFPGTEKEMVTMYHLDGDHLVLTHYCILGNQPRMQAEASSDVNQIAFKFAGASNLKSAGAQHMDHATLTLEGKDRLKSEWVSCEDGQTCHEVRFDLARKRK
jgi:hypothetical protein